MLWNGVLAEYDDNPCGDSGMGLVENHLENPRGRMGRRDVTLRCSTTAGQSAGTFCDQRTRVYRWMFQIHSMATSSYFLPDVGAIEIKVAP